LYVGAALLLLLAGASDYGYQIFFNLNVPISKSELPFIMEWSRLPYAMFFSAVICAGLSFPSFRIPKIPTVVRNFVALIVASYSISALAAAMLFAWLDFTGRDVKLNLWSPVQTFLNQHPMPLSPFSVALWVCLTPGAVAVLTGLLCTAYRRGFRQPFGVEFLILPISLATIGCAAFLIGSAGAERLSYAFTLVDPADFGWPMLPVLMLGSFGAWVVTTLTSRSRPTVPARTSADSATLGAAISSASGSALLILVLLYLGVSQTASYANRMTELVEARKAFASDVLYAFFKDGGALTLVETSSDGKLLWNWDVFTKVPWADVTISQYPGDDRYVVEVVRKLTEETWSALQYHQSFDTGNATQQVADRYGFRYETSDDAIKIYPRLEAQLQATDVSFPGIGISLDLTSFTLVMPIVVSACLILLGHWARTASRSYNHSRLQWILIDADNGLVGLVARCWLVAIGVGPWLLAILFIQAIALMLRSKGTLNTIALDGAASLYVVLTMSMLVVATMSAVKALVALRSTVRVSRENDG
jgi:hypothetical protein